MDDSEFILGNPEIVAPGEADFVDLLLQPNIGYIVPATGLVQAGLYRIGGGAPWVFHLANLLLHAAVVGLIVLAGLLLAGAAAVGALADFARPDARAGRTRWARVGWALAPSPRMDPAEQSAIVRRFFQCYS